MQAVIGGRIVEANEGDTILTVARKNLIYIPTLCYMEKIIPIGSCRLCLVEVEGYRNPVPACTTNVTDGMVIRVNTQNLREMRREMLKFILMRHPLDCRLCDLSDRCILENLIQEYEIDIQTYKAKTVKKEYIPFATPAIEYHAERCIACSRCIRTCREFIGRSVLDLKGNGFEARMEPAAPERCISCGECVSVCPVGALSDAATEPIRKTTYIKKIPTVCGYCGVGCSLELNVSDNKVVRVTSNEYAGTNRGTLCVKGRYGFEFINSPERLTDPLIRKNGELKEASWDEALDYVAARLRIIKNKYGSDSIAGLASAKCTNEDNYVFQKFMRAVIGTNNIDHCARL